MDVQRAQGTWAAVANIQFSEISSGGYPLESTADIGLALTLADFVVNRTSA